MFILSTVTYASSLSKAVLNFLFFGLGDWTVEQVTQRSDQIRVRGRCRISLPIELTPAKLRKDLSGIEF